MSNQLKLQKTVLDLFRNVSKPLSESDLILEENLYPVVKGIFDESERKIGILPKGRIFSTVNKDHMKEAIAVIELLMKTETNNMESILTQLRKNLNEELFIYATSVFFIHNPDSKILLPPIEEVFPEKFSTGDVIRKAMKENEKATDKSMIPIVIDVEYTSTSLEPEHALAYWREDIGLNAHHWHWHVVYPYEWPRDNKPKDRRGELFYYMHQQMIARYDCERLALGFPRVVPLHDWNTFIPEGYAPHLNKEIARTIYCYRPSNMILHEKKIDELRLMYEKIIQDLSSGFFIRNDDAKIQLDTVRGIDIIGNTVEASDASANMDRYGSLHNSGHDAIAKIHDPDGRFKLEAGVMADTATAMRDPIFYRWHKFIDNIFLKHKSRLTPYNREELMFEDVTIDTIYIQGKTSKAEDVIQTFWQESDLHLTNGIDFQNKVPVSVRYRHLQHEKFEWKIKVENKWNEDEQGTVRIFMAPIFGEGGKQLSPNEQRLLMIEMDKFEYTFEPGENVISRRSEQSNVTVQALKTYSELDAETMGDTKAGKIANESSCSCGLPDHLLIPRGSKDGMPFQTFAIITNAIEDRVKGKGQHCLDATSYCGAINDKYPDKKPMGFPFDRVINAADWSSFKTPNMGFGYITIRFEDIVK